MASVGVHPVFVGHYCGDKLYAAGLINGEVRKPCCKNAVADRSLQSDYPLVKSPACCRMQGIQISTDDFLPHTQAFSAVRTLPAFNSVWIILNCLWDGIKFDKSLIAQRLFPPGGISKQHIDLLTLICIFRI
jgi:hypothetical protein